MNSFVVEWKTLEKIVENSQKELFMAENYQLIKKEEKAYNYWLDRSENAECYSFERDIRNCISEIEEPELLVVERERSFLPVLTVDKEYSFEKMEKYVKDEMLHDPDYFNLLWYLSVVLIDSYDIDNKWRSFMGSEFSLFFVVLRIIDVKIEELGLLIVALAWSTQILLMYLSTICF